MTSAQKLVYSAFLGFLFASLACSPAKNAVAADAEGIAASAAEIDPLKTGEMAPTFTLRTVDDEPFVFDPENLDRPVILITFRGGWCPYCNLHLSELRNVVPELQDKGIDVYFLSGDRPEMLYQSLKRETQDDIDGLGYTILSDADMEAARALGIAFRVPDSMVTGMQDRGRDIDESSMENFQALPVPAVYVIDAKGKVTYSFVEPDYKIRLPAEDLLKAASAVVQ
jgi:peroxiredoxin